MHMFSSETLVWSFHSLASRGTHSCLVQKKLERLQLISHFIERVKTTTSTNENKTLGNVRDLSKNLR